MQIVDKKREIITSLFALHRSRLAYLTSIVEQEYLSVRTIRIIKIIKINKKNKNMFTTKKKEKCE